MVGPRVGPYDGTTGKMNSHLKEKHSVLVVSYSYHELLK